MTDETTSVWADIWAKAKGFAGYATGYPKTSWAVAGFIAGLATRLFF
jgi:hypothetical protein